IYRSTNGGQSFALANVGFVQANPLSGFMPIRQCPVNDDVFVAGTTVLQRTNNFFGGAASWSVNAPSGAQITAIAFAPSDSKCNIYAYGNAQGQVWITTNAGATWSNLDPNKTLPGRAVNSLAFDPTEPSVIYAALGGFNAGITLAGHLFKT